MKRVRALFFALIAVLSVTTSVMAVTLWQNATVAPSAEDYIRKHIAAEHYRVCGHAIVFNTKLSWASRYKAEDMGYRNKMSHPLIDGKMVWDFYNNAGIGWTYGAGEIVAWNNWPDDQSAAVAFKGWMNSDGHRAIIQNCDFDHFGVGVFKTKVGGGEGGKWYAAEFTNTSK